MKTKINPCPNCQSTELFIRGEQVSCRCGVSGPYVLLQPGQMPFQRTPEKAIEGWNKLGGNGIAEARKEMHAAVRQIVMEMMRSSRDAQDKVIRSAEEYLFKTNPLLKLTDDNTKP